MRPNSIGKSHWQHIATQYVGQWVDSTERTRTKPIEKITLETTLRRNMLANGLTPLSEVENSISKLPIPNPSQAGLEPSPDGSPKS